MAGFNPYESLGVNRDASADDIKKAYRRLARKYHPDHNPGNQEAEAKFKEVKKAYDILGDPSRRQQFDQYGFTGDEQPGGGGFGGFDAEGFGGINFEDIFSSMFGGGFGGQARQQNRRGSDVALDIKLDFEEAVFGVEKEISYRIYGQCGECSGTGARAGTAKKQCPDCHGSGQIRVMQNTLLGRMMQVRTCSRCEGHGKIITEPCPNCRGQGRIETTARKKINIPAGVDSGSRVRVPGGGHAGPQGGSPGDLFLLISVRDHKYFVRRDKDIHLEVPIGICQAALGVELEIPTLDGQEKLIIPPGTQPGTIFTWRGKGVPFVNRPGRGDQIIEISIEVPKKLTEKERELLRKLADNFGETVENVDKGLLSRLKRALGRR